MSLSIEVVIALDSVVYYKHGKIHRNNRPASINGFSGDRYWYIRGVRL
jgi:hypothetical protein